MTVRQTSWNRFCWCGTDPFTSQTIDLDPVGTVPSLIAFEDQMGDSSESNVYRSKKNHLNQVVSRLVNFTSSYIPCRYINRFRAAGLGECPW